MQPFQHIAGSASSAQSFLRMVTSAVLGAIIGASYGLLAVGLVLVYRSSKLVNFAHAETGAFAVLVGAQTLERMEQTLQVIRCDARTAVIV